MSEWVSEYPTCLTTGLDDAYDSPPQHVLWHSKVVLSLFKHRWRHQPSHHANVDSGIDVGN